MRPPFKRKSIAWMVWTLVATGLLAGAITNGLFGWTLAKLQNDRVKLVKEENDLVQSSLRLKRLIQETRAETTELLTEECKSITHETIKKDPAGELYSSLAELRQKTSDKDFLDLLSRLEITLNDLAPLWRDVLNWHNQFETLREDTANRITLNKTRQALYKLREPLDIVEGSQNLWEAIQLRKWRSASEPAAITIGHEIMGKHAGRVEHILAEAKADLYALEKQVETLAGEIHPDCLIDLKENKLKPHLEGLGRNLEILIESSVLEKQTLQTLALLKEALFGKGHIFDKKQQTIKTGTGGLYFLRYNELKLKNEQSRLLRAVQKYFQKIETYSPEMSNLLRIREQALSKQAEKELSKAMYSLLFLSIFALGVFWALGSNISKKLNHQVDTLAELRRHNELILNSAGEGIMGVNPKGEITFLNPAGAQMLGWEHEELIGKDPHQILHHSKPDGTPYPWEECPLCNVLKSGQDEKRDDELFWRKNGTRLPVQYVSTPIRNESGDLDGAVLMFLDISERKKSEKILAEKEQRLKYLAHHDTLTDLPNRLLFNDRLQHAMDIAHRSKKELAVLFIDLDRFKNVNDSLGHEIGDKLLCEVSKRLRKSLRDTDTIARLGGDEFVVIMEGIEDAHQISNIAQKILSRLSEAFRFGENQIYATASIGISIFPSDARDRQELIKCADAAMYRAKKQGRNNYQFYTSDMNTKAHELLLLENHMRKALENKEFILHYQPQFDLASPHRIVGVEALLRWQHPQKGLLPPKDFIPMAEETGLIVPIGKWVLSKACETNKKWQELGLPHIRMAVNISTRQFQQTDLVKTVAQALEETDLDPHFLELEITESMIMDDVGRGTSIMNELNKIGVKLAIDDFGTGYSSLTHLKHFPISKLKIDQSFVRDVSTDPNDAAISAAIIALGQSMNLEIIAEGVETVEQLNFLKERKCSLGQGFLFSPPLKIEDIENLFKKYS